MHVLFGTDKKFLNCMRYYDKTVVVKGDTELFVNRLSKLGCRWSKYRCAYVVPEGQRQSVEEIVVTLKKNKKDKKGKVVRLLDKCTVSMVTDPLHGDTIRRVGGRYLGTDPTSYIVINIPNDVYNGISGSLRNAADIKLKTLPEVSSDGTYEYSTELFQVIPKPPKIDKHMASRARIMELRSELATADLVSTPTERKIDMLFELTKLGYEINS